MATIGSLAVNIIARTDKFTAGIARARGQLGGLRGIAARSSAAIGGLGVSSAGAAAALFSLARTHDRLQKSMNASLAIMGDVSTAMRKDMVDAAIKVSRTTRFSASQAAESYFFLASAGMDAEQSLAAMPTVAAFAAAGNFDLATATDLATDAQSALGMTSKNAAANLKNLGRVTDVLIKANTLANASAQQFSEALTNKAGASLRLVNKDVEEGVAVLAAYADQGIKGAEAGTALGIVMRDLQTKSLLNAEAFALNGIAVFDSAGKMNRLADIIGDIENRLNGMSDAQKKATLLSVGFSDKSVAYIQTLVGTSEKIRAYEDALRSAAGATESVASKQMTALEKLTAKLRASWESLSNQMGPVFTMAAESASGWLDALTQKTSGAASGLSRIQSGFATLLDVLHTVRIGFKYVQATVTAVLGHVVSKIGQAIDLIVEQVNKIPGVDISSTSFPATYGQDLQLLAKSQYAEAAKLLRDKTPSERMADLARATERVAKSTATIVEESGKLPKSVGMPAVAAEASKFTTASHRSLTLTEAGSVESYRQQRRIDRQDGGMKKLAAKQLAKQGQMERHLARMAGAPVLMPANI